MRTNVKQKNTRRTHGGAVAHILKPEQELRRSVMSCMLWEKEFYEDGEVIADRIARLVGEVKQDIVASIAIEAREKMNLRHVPLWIVLGMVRNGFQNVRETLARVIQRPDELSEFLAMYWEDGKKPIANQVKRGLADAFIKFNEYQLAKYNRKYKVKLKTVMNLVHPKPKDDEQSAIFDRLLGDNLKSPDTWETSLSAGKNKKETFTRLLEENKLGALAILRNLRNMSELGISKNLVFGSLSRVDATRVLPFRYIAAANHVARWEENIEKAMIKSLVNVPKLPGKTVLVVDISGSMRATLSARSEIDRMDSAIALSILAREMCEEVVIYATAGNDYNRIHKTKIVPSRRGFALRDVIKNLYYSLGGGGIFLAQCMNYISEQEADKPDRVIVFTDEQDCDNNLNPETAQILGKKNYLVNIASAKNGIGYGRWHHIDGFSEVVLDYIRAFEESENLN